MGAHDNDYGGHEGQFSTPLALLAGGGGYLGRAEAVLPASPGLAELLIILKHPQKHPICCVIFTAAGNPAPRMGVEQVTPCSSSPTLGCLGGSLGSLDSREALNSSLETLGLRVGQCGGQK